MATNPSIRLIEIRIRDLKRRINIVTNQISRTNRQKEWWVNRYDYLLKRTWFRGGSLSLTDLRNRGIARFDANLKNLDSTKQQLEKQLSELEASLVFKPSSSDPTSPNTVDPAPSLTQQQKYELVSKTRIVYDSMVEYMKNEVGTGNDGQNDFIIPFIPKNFNLRINDLSRQHNGAQDWKDCYYPDLGNSKNNGSLYSLNWLELRGYFSAMNSSGKIVDLLGPTTKINSILSTGTFILKQLLIPPVSIGEDGVEVNLNYDVNDTQFTALRNQLNQYLDTTAIQAVVDIIIALNRWARDTAFLTKPTFCEQGASWYSWYGDPIYNPQSQPRVSDANVTRSICSSVVNPVCDLVYDITYTNECEAKKSGAIKIRDGACFNMIKAFDRTNLSVVQSPTQAWDTDGLKLKDSDTTVVSLPNELQAEYFSRLYAFMLKNYKKTASVNDLPAWAISYLQTYNVIPGGTTIVEPTIINDNLIVQQPGDVTYVNGDIDKATFSFTFTAHSTYRSKVLGYIIEEKRVLNTSSPDNVEWNTVGIIPVPDGTTSQVNVTYTVKDRQGVPTQQSNYIDNGTMYQNNIYYYRVKARLMSSNQILLSNIVSKQLIKSVLAPSVPRNLTTRQLANGVWLSWKQPLNLGDEKITNTNLVSINYRVQYKEVGNDIWIDYTNLQNSLDPTYGGEAGVLGLDPTKTYQFRIAAFNSSGTSDYITSSSVNPGTIPSGPSNVKAYSYLDGRSFFPWGISGTANKIFVDWDAIGGGVQYYVEMKEGSNDWGMGYFAGSLRYEVNAVTIGSETQTDQIVRRLGANLPDSDRLIRVRGNTNLGFSNWSDPVSVTDGSFLSPTELNVTTLVVGSTKTLNITWKRPNHRLTGGFAIQHYIVNYPINVNFGVTQNYNSVIVPSFEQSIAVQNIDKNITGFVYLSVVYANGLNVHHINQIKGFFL